MESMNAAPASEEDRLYRIRHSLAHVMAQAVLEMREGATLGFGPPIADGFYYDFISQSRSPRRIFRTSNGV